MEVKPQGIRRRVRFKVDSFLTERFTRRRLQRTEEECWPWLGAVRNGYGCIKHDHHLLSAHVVAWVLAHDKQVSEGQLICHTCDNRLCCNPAHLYEGTYADNVHDMDRRRIVARPHGTEVCNAVLTDDVVRIALALRVVNNWGQRRISNALHYNEGTIDSVIRRNTWTHIAIPTPQEAAEIVHAWKQAKANH